MTAILRRSGRHPSDGDLAGFAAAERFARDLATEIAEAAEPGMSEHDLAHLAKARFRQAGVRRHWHIPVVGLGPGSAKLRNIRSLLAGDVLARRRRLEADDDVVYVDIAPIHEGYPSDYTVTRVAGHHPEREQLIGAAHNFAARIVQRIGEHRDARGVWAWAVATASVDARFDLVEPPLVGLAHRIGVVPPSWPYVPEATTLAYLATRERGAFLGPRNRRPMDGFWTIEPYLVADGRAAKHEELIFVTGSEVLRLGAEDGL